MEFSEFELLLRLEYNNRNQPILVDVGAHRGGISYQFAKQGWQVIAFEPETSNYRQLCIKLEEFPKAFCINKAVSNITRNDVAFYVSSEHFGIHALKPFHETHLPTLTVDVVRLDEMLHKLNVEEVTVLKIDIEGADFLAIQSFDFKKYYPEVVLCEFMDKRSKKLYDYDHHDVVRFMHNIGYAAFVSEWSPIIEYFREDQRTNLPKFMRCVSYPLDHDPAWGNLIFVPRGKVADFEHTLKNYVRFKQLASYVKRIPGSTTLYRRFRQWWMFR